MSKGSRLVTKLKDKEERDWKNKKYHEMAEKGILGSKDKKNYQLILEDLSQSLCPKEILSFYYKVEKPGRKDYNDIKSLARQYTLNY
jgi:hypothetical protein